jgi:hypothetical protein
MGPVQSALGQHPREFRDSNHAPKIGHSVVECGHDKKATISTSVFRIGKCIPAIRPAVYVISRRSMAPAVGDGQEQRLAAWSPSPATSTTASSVSWSPAACAAPALSPRHRLNCRAGAILQRLSGGAPIYPTRSPACACVSDAVARRPRPSLLPLADSVSGTADGKGERTTFRRPSACHRAHPSPPHSHQSASLTTTPHAGSTDMSSAIDTRHNNLKCWGRLYPECGYLLSNPDPPGADEGLEAFAFAARIWHLL